MTEKKQEGSGEYALSVREATTRYVKDLLADNEKLRGLVRALEDELDRHKIERSRLEQRVASVEAECRRHLDQFVQVEMQNSNVANLYVASFRLHGTLERREVLAAMLEIVINLIGSEEVVVLELDERGETLRLATSFGLDEAPWRAVPASRGRIGETARSGRLYVAVDDSGAVAPEEEGLTACIPLLVGAKVTGVVAIFRMLEHKRGLEDVDHALFELLSKQAGTALYCTELHAKAIGGG